MPGADPNFLDRRGRASRHRARLKTGWRAITPAFGDRTGNAVAPGSDADAIYRADRADRTAQAIDEIDVVEASLRQSGSAHCKRRGSRRLPSLATWQLVLVWRTTCQCPPLAHRRPPQHGTERIDEGRTRGVACRIHAAGNASYGNDGCQSTERTRRTGLHRDSRRGSRDPVHAADDRYRSRPDRRQPPPDDKPRRSYLSAAQRAAANRSGKQRAGPACSPRTAAAGGSQGDVETGIAVSTASAADPSDYDAADASGSIT